MPQAIIQLDKRKATRSRRLLFAKYAGHGPEGERAFFRRVSGRQGGASATVPADSTSSCLTTARLEVVGRTVTQRASTDALERDVFFAGLPLVQPPTGLDGLDVAFTELDVRTAIQTCPRGKAAGPTECPTDWYSDHADRLVPILTTLFNAWHRQLTIPTSFRRATPRRRSHKPVWISGQLRCWIQTTTCTRVYYSTESECICR